MAVEAAEAAIPSTIGAPQWIIGCYVPMAGAMGFTKINQFLPAPITFLLCSAGGGRDYERR